MSPSPFSEEWLLVNKTAESRISRSEYTATELRWTKLPKVAVDWARIEHSVCYPTPWEA